MTRRAAGGDDAGGNAGGGQEKCGEMELCGLGTGIEIAPSGWWWNRAMEMFLTTKQWRKRFRKAGDPHVTEIAMETDHGYNDHRIALQAAVLNWLQSFGIVQGQS